MAALLLNKLMAVPLLVLFFSVSIFVHELGHYLAARMLGLVVDVFSIGFGPALWKRKYKGIVYKIGCIPVGGYVALPQLDPSGMQAVQGAENPSAERRLPPIAAWKKILVSVAGAAGNLLLAVAIAWLVYWIGIPAGPAERSSIVGYVDPQSAAAAQGLRAGDEVRSVNGRAVRNWREFMQEAALLKEVVLEVRTQTGETKKLSVPTERGVLGEQTVGGIDGRNLCSVLSVEPGMSAALAGILPGDLIVEFAGQEVFGRGHLIELVGRHKNQPATITVSREEGGRARLLEMRVTPAYDEASKQVRIGIVFNAAAVDLDSVVRPRPMEQLRQHAGAIFRFLRALVTPKQAKAASQAVGGPVAIVASYWIIVRTSIMLAIWFTGFLNVNLAIINLLPLPVLDGGHVLFSLWEVVTKRPVSARVVNVLVNAFAVLLIGVFVLLSVRDVDRFTPAGRLLRGVLSRNGQADASRAQAATATVERAAQGTNGP